MNAPTVASEQWLGPVARNRETPPVPTPAEELNQMKGE
jgi:hypothetical protein